LLVKPERQRSHTRVRPYEPHGFRRGGAMSPPAISPFEDLIGMIDVDISDVSATVKE